MPLTEHVPQLLLCKIPNTSITRSISGIPRALNAPAGASVASNIILARSAMSQPHQLADMTRPEKRGSSLPSAKRPSDPRFNLRDRQQSANIKETHHAAPTHLSKTRFFGSLGASIINFMTPFLKSSAVTYIYPLPHRSHPHTNNAPHHQTFPRKSPQTTPRSMLYPPAKSSHATYTSD